MLFVVNVLFDQGPWISGLFVSTTTHYIFYGFIFLIFLLIYLGINEFFLKCNTSLSLWLFVIKKHVLSIWLKRINWGGREAEKGGDICIYIADLHCYIAETNNIVKQLCSILKINLKTGWGKAVSLKVPWLLSWTERHFVFFFEWRLSVSLCYFFNDEMAEKEFSCCACIIPYLPLEASFVIWILEELHSRKISLPSEYNVVRKFSLGFDKGI